MLDKYYDSLVTGFYINVKKDIDRNLLMAEQIKTLKLPYRKFQAKDKSLYQSYERPQYVAHGESNLEILKKGLTTFNSHKHLHILEDDVTFSRDIKKYLSKVLKSLEHQEWDILFTDVILSLDTNLFELENYYEIYKNKNKLALLNLKEYNFAGSASFIVNNKSIKKVHGLLNHIDSFDKKAFDLQIRTLSHTNKLKVKTIFPFLTKTSINSQISTIENRNTTWEIASELLREHFYIDNEKETTNNQYLIDYFKTIKLNKRKELLLNIMKYRQSDVYTPI